jgi:phage terminase small subunit
MADERRLTPKQQRFVNAYLGAAKGNGAEAARLAGYKDGAGLRQAAVQLLTMTDVRAAIDAQLAAETLSAAEVLHHLTDVGMAEWHEFVEVVVNPRTGETLKVRMDLTNKVKALELLGKFHKLFTDKQESTSNVLIREYADGDA